MATARALLRRLLAGARSRRRGAGRGAGAADSVAASGSAGDRLDAARQRLKQTIAPVEEASAGEDRGSAE